MKKQSHLLLLLIFIMLGYSCQTEDVTGTQSAKLKARIKFTIGQVTYDNTNAPVTVTGYDEAGLKNWSKTYQASGQDVELDVKLGFHHYIIETNHWGIHDEVKVTADELWKRRTNGPTPAVYELGGSLPARKLSYYTEFFFDETFGFQPQAKVRYEYNDADELTSYFVYGFDPTYKSLIELRYYNFSYSNNHVDKIIGYLTGNSNPIVQYSYEYSPDSQVTKIKEENYQAGINSEVRLNYDLTLNTVTALYTFSNGTGFTYTYEMTNKNISTDKTTRGSQVCSTGEYTYDTGINPFSLLGYTDYTLNNISINNRLTESADYINCSFPSLVPQSYSHVYDSEGYPIVSTTYYKSGGMSRKAFIYK